MAILLFLGTFHTPSVLRAGEPDSASSKSSVTEEFVEKTGRIGKERARQGFRRWSRDEVLVLYTENGAFSLLRGRNKRVVAQVEAYLGKRLTVTGLIVPASTRHPRPGLKVYAFKEAMELSLASDSSFLPSPPPLPELPAK